MHTSTYATTPTNLPAPSPWAVSSPDIQALCLVWDGYRAGRLMPRQDEIDFREMASVFPNALLAEPVPVANGVSSHRFLPIEALSDIGAGDPSGWLDPSLLQHIPADRCQMVATRQEPHLERVSLLSADGILVDYEIVFLPLVPPAKADKAGAGTLLILAIELSPAD